MIALLIIHGLVAFALLGAITHQLIVVWVPARQAAGHFVGRLRTVAGTSYVNAIAVLFLVQMVLGGIIYTNYRIGARISLEQARVYFPVGLFELKEHFVSIGLAVLPAYWYFWRRPLADEHAWTRAILTTLLAFIVWYSFLVGHILNNLRGIG